MAKAKRKALVVLGMHRSGTSALGGVLVRLGAAAPKTLMPPTDDNPRGYAESVRFMKFHDDILASSGSRWNDWGKFNPDWFESDAAEEFREQLPQLLAEEFGNARLFLLKDPRVCRFFPFWIQACRELEIDLKAIIPIRHPFEVAQSLHTRDRFGRARALLIWLRHVLDAEFASRGVDRSFLRYTDLMADWRSEVSRLSRQLEMKWPRWSSEVETEIDDFLEPELRRQKSESTRADAEGVLATWVREVNRSLEQMIDEPQDCGEALQVLDGIRAEFDRTAEVYGVVVHEETAIAEAKAEQAEGEAEQQQDRAARLEADLAALARTEAEAQARLTEQSEAVRELQMELTEAKRAGNQAHSRLTEQSEVVRRLQGELADGTKQRAEIETSLREKERALQDVQGELAAELGKVGQMEVEAGKMMSRIRSMELDLIRQEDQKRTSVTEIAALSRRMLALQAGTEDLQRANVALTQEREAQDREYARDTGRMLAEREALERANDGLQQQRAQLEQQNAQLVQEIDDLLHSTSWRMTAPARAMSSALRSLRRRTKTTVPLLERDR